MEDSLFHALNGDTILDEPSFSDEQNALKEEFNNVIEKPNSWKFKRIKKILFGHDQKHRSEFHRHVQSMLVEKRSKKKKMMGLSL